MVKRYKVRIRSEEVIMEQRGPTEEECDEEFRRACRELFTRVKVDPDADLIESEIVSS